MARESEGYDKLKREVAARLYEVEGIKFGEFTLTSGKTSPYYIDLRVVPSYPDLFDKVTEISARIVKDEIKKVDRLAGVPTGGLPFAALVAHKSRHPLLYPRKKKKSHGRKRNVEGILKEGDHVAVLDDISTTGGSIEDAAETIRNNDGVVEHAVVMVDREEGAGENLKQSEITLHSCLNVSEILDYLQRDSIISEDERETILDYLESQS